MANGINAFTGVVLGISASFMIAEIPTQRDSVYATRTTSHTSIASTAKAVLKSKTTSP